MRKIAGYLTKNRSEKDQKIAQSTHEKGYIKPRKTFWRNSKQLLNQFKTVSYFFEKNILAYCCCKIICISLLAIRDIYRFTDSRLYTLIYYSPAEFPF